LEEHSLYSFLRNREFLSEKMYVAYEVLAEMAAPCLVGRPYELRARLWSISSYSLCQRPLVLEPLQDF
jgi:hypothetical protein